jgi:hypothetical protein
MRLSDVLLDTRVRARLDLNDEQVKKIQEINDKRANSVILGLNRTQAEVDYLRATNLQAYIDPVRLADLTTAKFSTHFLYTDLSDESRAELIKILTPQQRQTLEKLSGMTLEKKK